MLHDAHINSMGSIGEHLVTTLTPGLGGIIDEFSANYARYIPLETPSKNNYHNAIITALIRAENESRCY